MMISAYSYTELSDFKNHKSDCDHQHSKEIERYANENNLTLTAIKLAEHDTSPHNESISDVALLNAYFACVKQGKIKKKSILLIESFIQISQRFITEVYPILIDLLNLDVEIVTIFDNRRFTKATYREDHGTSLISSLMTILKNYEVNQKRKEKSIQIKTGWQNLRDGTGQHPRKIITSTCPSWLTVQNDEWQTDQTKVNTIKRIFELALAGNGAPTIAKTLRNENRMPLGKYEFEWNTDLISKVVNNKIEIDSTQYKTVLKIIDMSKAGITFSEIASTCRAEQIPKLRKFDCGWTANTVSHVLRNKSVIGILETSKISARENYYPSIVDRDIFNSVQQLIDKRNFAPSVKSDGLVGNLFAGLSRCGLCGAKMKTISATKNRKLTIKCEIAYSNKIVQTDGSYKGQVCPADAVQYVEFEKQLMKWFENTERNIFKKMTKVVNDRRSIEMQISEKEKAVEKLVDLLLENPKSEALKKRLKETEVQVTALREKISFTSNPIDDINQIEVIQSNYHYHYALNDMLRGSNFYEKFSNIDKIRWEIIDDPSLPKSKRDSGIRSFQRHDRLVIDFGADYPTQYLNNEILKEKIRVKLNEVRKEMQVGIRKLVSRIEFHNLPTIHEKPAGGYTGKIKADWSSYKLTLNSGGKFQRWYMRK